MSTAEGDFSRFSRIYQRANDCAHQRSQLNGSTVGEMDPVDEDPRSEAFPEVIPATSKPVVEEGIDEHPCQHSPRSPLIGLDLCGSRSRDREKRRMQVQQSIGLSQLPDVRVPTVHETPSPRVGLLPEG